MFLDFSFKFSILGKRLFVICECDSLNEAMKTRRPFDFVAGPAFTSAAATTCPHGDKQLVSSTGDAHTRLRKLQAPAFTKLTLSRLQTQIAGHLRVVERLIPKSASFELSGEEVQNMALEYTLAVSTDLVFGLELTETTVSFFFFFSIWPQGLCA